MGTAFIINVEEEMKKCRKERKLTSKQPKLFSYLEMLNRLQEAASSVTASMNNAGSLFEDGRTGSFFWTV